MGYYNFFILLFSGILAITTSLLVYYNNKLFNVNKGMLKYQESLLKNQEKMLKYQEVFFKLNVIINVSKQIGDKKHQPDNFDILFNAINKAMPEYEEEIKGWFKPYLYN